MKYFVNVLILLLISGSVCAEKTLFYKTYKEKTGEIVAETSFHIGDPSDDKIVVQWKIRTHDATVEQISNPAFATQSWKVLNPKEDTNYTGERKGNQIFIKGRHKGEEIDKRIKIDDKPFFFFPALGLSEFVQSGKKSLEFWTMRPDNLKKYKMKAKNEGTEVITVSGEKVETIEVKWGLKGLLFRFFNQTFWFRKSDGVFVKSKLSDEAFTELVDEK